MHFTFTAPEELIKAIREAAKDGRVVRVCELVQWGQANGIGNQELAVSLTDLTMEVCEIFSRDEIYFHEFYLAIDSLDKAMHILLPYLKRNSEPVLSGVDVILGTIQGDVHEMGRTVLRMLLEKEGFTVIDLGTDIKPRDFVASIRENNARVLGVSCLLTPALAGIKQLQKELKEAGQEHIFTIMGGKATSRDFAASVGFTVWAPDAVEGAKLITAHLRP